MMLFTILPTLHRNRPGGNENDTRNVLHSANSAKVSRLSPKRDYAYSLIPFWAARSDSGHQDKLKLLEQELVELHPDARPTYQQAGLYRLILELEHEKLKLPHLFAARIAGLWTSFEQSYQNAAPLTQQRMRRQFSEQYRDLHRRGALFH